MVSGLESAHARVPNLNLDFHSWPLSALLASTEWQRAARCARSMFERLPRAASVAARVAPRRALTSGPLRFTSRCRRRRRLVPSAIRVASGRHRRGSR